MLHPPTSRHATFTGLLLFGLLVRTPSTGFAQDDTWENLASMPTPRLGLCAAAVDGKVYAIGGYRIATVVGLTTVEMYDPTSDAWTTKAPMPTARRWLACSALNGRIYVVGGFRIEGTPALTTVEVYDPDADSWTTAAPLPVGRKGLATAVVDGMLYAIGGADPNEQLLATMDVYDPATDSWSSRASMSAGRAMLTASAVNNEIIAVGGPGPAQPGVSTVEAYDPETDTWTSRADLPEPRWGLSSSAIDDRLFAIGGASFTTAYSQVESYDPIADTWTGLEPIRSFDEPGDGARWAFATAVVDGKIYAIGGATNPAQPPHPGLSRMQAYTPPAIQTDLEDSGAELPLVKRRMLRKNYPNPFSRSTTITLEIDHPQTVRLVVLDALGRLVRVFDEEIGGTSGIHKVIVDADELPSGLYFYRLETPSATVTRMMMLVR